MKEALVGIINCLCSSRDPIDQFLTTNFLLPQILQTAQNALQAALPDIRWVNMILALR